MAARRHYCLQATCQESQAVNAHHLEGGRGSKLVFLIQCYSITSLCSPTTVITILSSISGFRPQLLLPSAPIWLHTLPSLKPEVTVDTTIRSRRIYVEVQLLILSPSPSTDLDIVSLTDHHSHSYTFYTYICTNPRRSCMPKLRSLAAANYSTEVVLLTSFPTGLLKTVPLP